MNDKLSVTELSVVIHLCTLGTNKAIANALNISEGTSKAHIRNILKKTGIANRTLLAVWAVKIGIDK